MYAFYQKDIDMKLLYVLMIVYIGFFLSSCATTHHTSKTQTSVAANKSNTIQPLQKNPLAIAMYKEGEQPPQLSYKILGTETISKFNAGGIKRQTASIHDAMSNLAAKMGGDAIIHIENSDKTVTGTVITYQDNTDLKIPA
jgi:hypothetical protein